MSTQIKESPAQTATDLTREEAQLLYAAAVQEANLVVWEYDIPRHLVLMADDDFTNQDYHKFGLPRIVENAPQSLVPYIDEAYVETFLDMYRRIEAGAPAADCYVWYKLQPGVEPRYMHIVYNTVFDAQGKPVKAFGVGHNLTAEKLARDEYERLYRQLMGNHQDSVGSFQLNLSKNLYLDGYSPYPSVVKLLHTKTADEHFAATATTVLDPKLQQEILRDYNCQHLLQLFKEGTRQLDIEYPTGTTYGGIIWVHTAFYLLQNPATGDVEGISHCADVTGQKRNQEIISRMTGTSCDYVGVIDTINNAFDARAGAWIESGGLERQKFGYNVIRERLATKHIDPDDRGAFMEATEIAELRRHLREKPQHVVTYRFYLQPEDRERLRKQIVYYWLNEGHREILVVQQDVTEVHRLEQARIAELEQARKAAEAANVAKSEFLSRMSHDIRTPINGILGMTYLTREMELPPAARENLAQIDTSSKFLLSLINDVLDMSKAESGRIDLHPEPYPADEFRDYIESVLGPLFRRRNQTLTFEMAEFVADLVPLFDKLHINQIVFNLLSNASKYTPEGGRIRYRIWEKRLPRDRMHMTVEVIDNGIGMSEAFQKIIFEPFTQEDRGERQELQGTGLGMAIVKKLVDAMHGTVTVKSKLNAGSTFRLDFDLDCIPAQQAGSGKAQKAAAEGTADLHGKHVLVCEDHPLNRKIMDALLQKQGLQVTDAENGQTGLKIFANAPLNFFDAVVMDIRMPVMDGYTATRKIRSLGRSDAKTTPIIGLSANAFAEDVATAKAAGMNAYLAKPVNPADLYATLKKYVQ
jgi:signal transduction histidine kinase/ActR/RegA family two-component response regulator